MFVPKAYDVYITYGATTYGLMLLKKGRARKWSQRDANVLAPAWRTGEMTEAQFPPDVQLTWTPRSWRMGIGQELENIEGNSGAYALSSGVIALDQDALYPTPTSTRPTFDLAPDTYRPTGFAPWGTELWCFVGTYPYQWDWTNLNWDRKTQWATTSTPLGHNGTLFEGWVVVPTWLAADDTADDYYLKSTAGDTWAKATGTPPKFKYFAVADNKLWGANKGSTSEHHVQSCTDPTAAANWSAATAIGTSDAEITGLSTDGTTLLVRKTDGIWSLASDGTVQHLTPQWKNEQHPHNLRAAVATSRGTFLLAPGVPGLLYELVGSELVPKPFTKISSNLTGLGAVDLTTYICLEMATDTKYVYALMSNSALTDLIVLVGERYQGDYRWHVLYDYSTLANAAGRQQVALFADGVTGPSGQIHHRVWIAWNDAGVTAYRPDYQAWPNDVLADSYEQSYLAYLSDWDYGMPNVNKSLTSLSLTGGNLSTLATNTKKWICSYSLDGGAWVTLGTFYSDVTTISFPAGTVAKKLSLSFQAGMSGAGANAKIELIDLKLIGNLRVAAQKVIQYQFYLADGQILGNGMMEKQYQTKLAQLRTWNTQAAPLTLTDIWGTSRTVVSLPGTMQEVEVAKEAGRRPEVAVSMAFLEV